jgi:hypothetical protein
MMAFRTIVTNFQYLYVPVPVFSFCGRLVDRYLRKLDQELHKFQLELEADNRSEII